jgi:hypothetical protein
MIFPGTSDIGTLQLIFNLIGSPVTYVLFSLPFGLTPKICPIISILAILCLLVFARC